MSSSSSSLLSLPGNETATIKNTISTVGDKKNDAMTTTMTTPMMMVPNETNNGKSLTKYTVTTTTAKPSTTKTKTSITDWEASVSLAKAIMGAGRYVCTLLFFFL